MEEIDIWRSAAELVRNYGEDAVLYAARYMHEIERGDPKGETVWKHIIRAIEQLQTTAAEQSGSVH